MEEKEKKGKKRKKKTDLASVRRAKQATNSEHATSVLTFQSKHLLALAYECVAVFILFTFSRYTGD